MMVHVGCNISIHKNVEMVMVLVLIMYEELVV